MKRHRKVDHSFRLLNKLSQQRCLWLVLVMTTLGVFNNVSSVRINSKSLNKLHIHLRLQNWSCYLSSIQ